MLRHEKGILNKEVSTGFVVIIATENGMLYLLL